MNVRESAIGYLRKSKKDQSHHSLEYQEDSIRQYCIRNNLELKALFVDDGESSYSFDRPDYNALEDFIRSNKKGIRYLIVMDHDRFSRNLPEALMKIDQLEKKFSLKVLATSEALDIDTNDPSVFMLRAFKYLVANQELFTIRKRAKMGIRQAQISGRYVSMAPFGYINAKVNDGKGILRIDEAKSFIVQKIFRDYLSGIPHYQIYKEVRKLGFPNGGNSAIVRVLRNPVYAGLVRVVATDKEPERLVKGLHEAIITSEQYWRAQQLMEDKKRRKKVQPKDEFPLRGILKSPCCGSNMTAGWSKGKYKYYLYYRCIKHSNFNVPGKILHEKFDQLLSLLDFTAEQVEKLQKKVGLGLKNMMKVQAAQIKTKEDQLGDLEPKISNLEEKYINNDINSETYRKWQQKYAVERARLQEELRFLKNDVEKRTREDLKLLPKLQQISSIYHMATINQQHAIINAIFKDGLVFSDGVFRTPSIHPAFSHNLSIMKERGLLITERSPVGTQQLPTGEEKNPLDVLNPVLRVLPGINEHPTLHKKDKPLPKISKRKKGKGI